MTTTLDKSTKIWLKFSLAIFRKLHVLSHPITSFHVKNGVQIVLKIKHFKNETRKKASNGICSRPLIFKLQQEVLKFNDVCKLTWQPIF